MLVMIMALNLAQSHSPALLAELEANIFTILHIFTCPDRQIVRADLLQSKTPVESNSTNFLESHLAMSYRHLVRPTFGAANPVVSDNRAIQARSAEGKSRLLGSLRHFNLRAVI
jgi:hypothetical protein